MNPIVSIIMPCHNGAATIADAIRSVQNQTFSDWELIVVDDSSSDNSVSVVQQFAEKDTRVRLLRTEKSSRLPATPRNEGIEAAVGRYIAFLDCDDEWLPTKLAQQLPLFATRTVAVVFSYYGKMKTDGTFQNEIIHAPTVLTYKRLLKSNCIGNLTGIYDTQKIGKIFQKEIHHEDYLMWLEILKRGVIALNTNTYEAFYRVQKSSVSGNKIKSMQWHWQILRRELKLPFFEAVGNFLFYGIGEIAKRVILPIHK